MVLFQVVTSGTVHRVALQSPVRFLWWSVVHPIVLARTQRSNPRNARFPKIEDRKSQPSTINHLGQGSMGFASPVARLYPLHFLPALLALCLLSTTAALAGSLDNTRMSNNNKMIVATRLHLGQSAVPPTDLDAKVAGFHQFCSQSCPEGTLAVLAVDATPKIPGYNLVDAVQAACDKACACALSSSTSTKTKTTTLTVLPVTPWGKFVPALNALVQYAASQTDCGKILFCSAETTATTGAVSSLQAALQADTLVAGALLPGHDYKDFTTSPQSLNGRTSPWNTLALWDLRKLALTGFLLVSDGLLTDDATDPSYGIEEVAATALLQNLLGPDETKSKLVKVPGIEWDVGNFDDPERAAWQAEKMKSKGSRAARQLELTGLSGFVYHC